MSININIFSIDYNSNYTDNEDVIEQNTKCFPSYYPYNECIYDLFIILCKCIFILGCITGIIIIIIICI